MQSHPGFLSCVIPGCGDISTTNYGIGCFTGVWFPEPAPLLSFQSHTQRYARLRQAAVIARERYGMHILTFKTFIYLMTVLTLVVSTTNVLAANRVILGNVIQMPLSASNDPDTVKILGNIHQQIKAKGAIRIIVGIRVAFAPEGSLDTESAAQQRKEIAQMQSLVLEKIPALKQKSEQIKRYSSMPFMALEVNAAELEALISLTEITSIGEDALAVPLLKME
jgi:hypothetical protein